MVHRRVDVRVEAVLVCMVINVGDTAVYSARARE
jgi:hypothetical protein